MAVRACLLSRNPCHTAYPQVAPKMGLPLLLCTRLLTCVRNEALPSRTMAWKRLVFFFLLERTVASLAPRATPVIEAERALITPSPVYRDATRTYHNRRGVISDITQALATDLNSIFSELGSGVPSYVASGVPNYFQGFPTGDQVLSSAGVSSSDLQATPTQVLNIPYAERSPANCMSDLANCSQWLWELD